MERDKAKFADAVDSSISLVEEDQPPAMEFAQRIESESDSEKKPSQERSAAQTPPQARSAGHPSEHVAGKDEGDSTASPTQDDLKYALGFPARFTQISLLGEGGMSLVYKATDTANGDRVVALKLLRKELSRDQLVVERFLREGRAMQALSHENIAQVFESGKTENNMPFIVLEYVDGGSVADAIQREGHLDPERTRNIVKQICKALETAHNRGIIHRDIKPSNILLAADENGAEVAKLVDFGIAKPPSTEPLFNTDLTGTGMILGSPAYMSPEQCKGVEVDERSDVYSLGCVMYEALTGRCPFEAASPVKAIVRHLNEPPAAFDVEHQSLAIPPGLEEIVMKCLEKQPKQRYQNARQVEAALTSTIIPARRSVLFAEAFDLFLYLILASQIVPTISSLCIKLIHVDPTALRWHNLTDPQSSLFVASFILPLIWSWAAYYGLFEASKWQATPGKLLNGIKVRDRSNGRLSLAAALLCPMSFISVLACVWFVPIAAWTYLPFVHSSSDWITEIICYSSVVVAAANVVGLALTGNYFSNMLFGRTLGRPTAEAARHRRKSSAAQWLMLVFFALLPIILMAGTMQFYKQMAFSGSVPLVVADRQITAGQKIQDTDLVVIHTNKFFVPIQPAVKTKEELIGRIAEMGIPSGDPVTTNEILPVSLWQAGYAHHGEILGLYDPFINPNEPITEKNYQQIFARQKKHMDDEKSTQTTDDEPPSNQSTAE